MSAFSNEVSNDLERTIQKDNNTIVHCVIHCEKVFEKKENKNMSHYDVDIENLGRKAQ